MKTLQIRKNLPTLSSQKNHQHNQKVRSLHSNSSFLLFESTKQILLKSDSLPLAIHLHITGRDQIAIYVYPGSILIRVAQESRNLPYVLGDKKWLKISFGSQIERVEVRREQNENIITKQCAFSNEDAWRNSMKGQIQSVRGLSIQKLLSISKEEHQMVNRQIPENRSRLKGLIRSKLTQKDKPLSKQLRVSSLRTKQHSLYETSIDQSSTGGLGIDKKYGSTSLHSNTILERRKKLSKRSSNTAATIRTLAQDKVVQQKSMISQYTKLKLGKIASFFAEQEQTLYSCPQKPRFYEKIPITHEQLTLKRKKFDSQYIKNDNEGEVLPATKNDSEVIEEIIKDVSGVNHHLEDTFERGLRHDNDQPNTRVEDQSGTLCESVFQ